MILVFFIFVDARVVALLLNRIQAELGGCVDRISETIIAGRELDGK